jgi:hypothetical protein
MIFAHAHCAIVVSKVRTRLPNRKQQALRSRRGKGRAPARGNERGLHAPIKADPGADRHPPAAIPDGRLREHLRWPLGRGVPTRDQPLRKFPHSVIAARIIVSCDVAVLHASGFVKAEAIT